MKILKPLAVLGLISVAACTSRLDSVNNNPPAGDAFQVALHQGYIEIARMEYAEYDRKDGCTFVDRADASSMGTSVLPEEISARKLPANKVSVLTSARARLMRALDAGAAQSHPKEAARAQVMFDCWMQEQEENKQPEDVAFCQSAFTMAMEKIEYKEPVPVVAAAEPAPAPVVVPAPEPAPEPAPAALPTGMHIYFDMDSSALTSAAASIVKKAVGVLNGFGAKSVILQAHTDSAGSNDYNMKLAGKRANAVKQKLIEMGVPASAIMLDIRGEESLIVSTADGMAEPENRRVQFVFKR